ncbi:MAG: GTPase domain-containing protein [Candidatus Lokiarchaeota archaeon]|nr:GTPase domain-containing protein [Candidatus Lokiarchaeota archaeon]
MVNIGLLGDVSVGKTSILRLFVRYLKKGDIENVEGGAKCSVVKADFSGEATVPGGDKEDARNEKETKTIHPNRIVFREDTTNKAHTIFAPGGDRQRAVVKMGIITISRIATQIIAVFSGDRDLDPQFEFFNDVRFFPDKIYVCINKVDLIEGDREKRIEEMTKQIQNFFETRKISIREVFITCGETVDNFDEVEKYNNRVAEMILEITTKS